MVTHTGRIKTYTHKNISSINMRAVCTLQRPPNSYTLSAAKTCDVLANQIKSNQIKIKCVLYYPYLNASMLCIISAPVVHPCAHHSYAALAKTNKMANMMVRHLRECMRGKQPLLGLDMCTHKYMRIMC